MITFQWDKNKEKLNIKKHKISFEEAKSVFLDEEAKMIEDPDHSETEERFILLGSSTNLNILTVVHCFRHENKIIRIISARKANKKEENFYRGK